MVSNDKSICQNCGSKLKRYDKVSRIVRTKGGKTSWIEIERFRCPVCGQIHRELPDYIFPYKQYEAEVIRGVLEGFITCETYGRVDRCEVREDICGLVYEELESRTNYEVMFFTAGEYSAYGVPMFQVENHYFSRYE